MLLPTKLSNSLIVLNFLSFNPYPHFHNSDGVLFSEFPFSRSHFSISTSSFTDYVSLFIPSPTLNNTLPIKFPALIHQLLSLLTNTAEYIIYTLFTFIRWFSELPFPLSTFFISPLPTSTSSFTVYTSLFSAPRDYIKLFLSNFQP